MKLLHASLVALLAAGACAGAMAQWKWRDASGVVQYSDRPPPSGTPEKNILERPTPARVAAPAPAAAASALPGAPGAAASAPRGVDTELEARRKQLEQEQQSKDAATKKADEQRIAAERAENCKRARSALRSMEEGMRLVRTNEKGEREVLDDKGRAEEMTRARSVIASDCK